MKSLKQLVLISLLIMGWANFFALLYMYNSREYELANKSFTITDVINLRQYSTHKYKCYIKDGNISISFEDLETRNEVMLQNDFIILRQ